ncbi:unnamed protein product, partial [marine sediment metagenome]
LRQEAAVRFLGGRERGELLGLYSDYDMVLVPSVCEEGGPLVAIEALARGVPVVAARSGGIVDAVSDGVEGLLVEPGDASALAGAVRRLSGDSSLRREMARRAIEKVRARFLLEDHVMQTETLLARVAAAGRPQKTVTVPADGDVSHVASPKPSGARRRPNVRRALALLAGLADHVGHRILSRGRAEWSIGVCNGPGPFRLEPCPDASNPVLTAADVTDVRASFVADPFMILSGGVWHMFFEVMDAQRRLGVIGLATSDDARRWTYQRVVLAEPFHLSYPHVF